MPVTRDRPLNDRPAPHGCGGRRIVAMLIALLLALLAISPVSAQDRLRVSAARRGTWDGAVIEIAQRLGIMARHDITIDVNYVWNSRDVIRAVTTGAADIGVAADAVDVIQAFAANTPVRIIANHSAGAHDLYWYVRASSPIRGWADIDGHTIAYSTDCCTRGVVEALIQERRLRARPVATGWPSPTLTQVLSGQIDIGWATPPAGLEHLDQGKIRILAQGNDTIFANRTLRVVITSPTRPGSRSPAARNDVLARFMRGWRQTLEAMYVEQGGGLQTYADWRRMPIDKARRLRDRFFPRIMMDPDRIIGLNETAAEAIKGPRASPAMPELNPTATPVPSLEGLVQPPP